MMKQWGVRNDTYSGDESKTDGGQEESVFCVKAGPGGELTYAHIFIVQFCRGIAVVAQLAQLAVLASSVVLTAHANDGVQHLDVAASVGVAKALTVLQRQRSSVKGREQKKERKGKRRKKKRDAVESVGIVAFAVRAAAVGLARV